MTVEFRIPDAVTVDHRARRDEGLPHCLDSPGSQRRVLSYYFEQTPGDMPNFYVEQCDSEGPVANDRRPGNPTMILSSGYRNFRPPWLTSSV